MGWGNLAIQEEHIALSAWIWLECVPKHSGQVTQQQAVESWAAFRVEPNSTAPRVVALRRVTGGLFLGYVQLN